MTENEWWAATDPRLLVDWLFFDALASDRKLRLFSVACCGPLRPLVGDPRILVALEAAEAFADGKIDAATLRTTNIAAWGHHSRLDRGYEVISAEVRNAETVCLYTTSQDLHRNHDSYRWGDDAPYALRLTEFIDYPNRTNPSFLRLVHLLHDIFGPLPFRDIAIQPSWLTSDVLALARGIYDGKAFDRMPILADALQDAGCENDEILNHCREQGWEHVRGCWVIDLLLGRPWRES